MFSWENEAKRAFYNTALQGEWESMSRNIRKPAFNICK